MLKVPFYKPSIGPEEIDEVVDTLKSGCSKPKQKFGKQKAETTAQANF